LTGAAKWAKREQERGDKIMTLKELPNKPADFVIEAGEWATVWMFTPKTDRAKRFVGENLEIEEWQWVDKLDDENATFAVDHRPARELAAHLTYDHGMNVFHPSYGYFGGVR
jgi:hypothetical protein